jgi:hypothetical protein
VLKKITKNLAKLKVEVMSLPWIYLSVDAHFIFEAVPQLLKEGPPYHPQKRKN